MDNHSKMKKQQQYASPEFEVVPYKLLRVPHRIEDELTMCL